MRQQPPIHSVWWQEGTIDGVPIMDALARQDISALFRFLHARGWSRAAIAAATGLAENRIRRISQGRQEVTSYEVLERIATGLGIERGWMGLAFTRAPQDQGVHRDRGTKTPQRGLPSGTPVSTVDDMDRRGLLAGTPALAAAALFSAGASPLTGEPGIAHLVAGTDAGEPAVRVSLVDVEHIETITATFRQWGHQWGGAMAQAAARAQLQQVVSALTNATFDQPGLRKRLLVAAADLAYIAGFACFDAERHDEARRLYLFAVDAAAQGGRPDLAGWTLLGGLTLQAIHLGRPDEALRLVGLARATVTDSANPVPALSRAAVDAHEGWCLGVTGQHEASERAFGLAYEHVDRVDGGEVPQWLSDFDTAHVTWIHGRAQQALTHHDPALARSARVLLTDALTARPTGFNRGHTLNLITLSAAYFQGDAEVEEGVRIGHEALAGVRALNAPRVTARFTDIVNASQPFTGHADVAELHHQAKPISPPQT